MANFRINNDKPINNTDSVSIKNNLKNVNPFTPLSGENTIKIFKNPYPLVNASDNERHNVRLSLDTTAIQQEKYNYYVDNFRPGFPLLNNYILCPQKISTVFNNGLSYWTTSYDATSQQLSFNRVAANINSCQDDPASCPDTSYFDLNISNIYFDGNNIVFNKTIQIPRFLLLTVVDSKCLNINGEYIFDLATNSMYSTNTNIFTANITISSFPEDLILIVLYPEDNTDKYLSIRSKFIVDPSTETLQDSWTVAAPSTLGKAEVVGCLSCSNTNGSMEGFRVEGIYINNGQNVLCYPQVAENSEYILPIDININESGVIFGLYTIIPGYAGFNSGEFNKNLVPHYVFNFNQKANDLTIELARTQIYKFDLSHTSLTGLNLDIYLDKDHTSAYSGVSVSGTVGSSGSYLLLESSFDPPNPISEILYWTLGSYSGSLKLPLPPTQDNPPDFASSFNVPAPCFGGHGCSRARMDILINDVRTIESNLNNTLSYAAEGLAAQAAPSGTLIYDSSQMSFGRKNIPVNIWETLYDSELVNRLKTSSGQQWPRYSAFNYESIYLNELDLGPVHVVNGEITPEGIGLGLGDRLTYGYISRETNNNIFMNAPPMDPSFSGDIATYNVSIRTAPYNGQFVDKNTDELLSGIDWDNRVPNGIWTGGHKGVTWVRIKDCSGRVVYSCCVGEGYGNPSNPTPCPSCPPPSPPIPPDPVSPDCKIYFCNSGSNTVSAFSTKSNSIYKTITVGNGPVHVTFHPKEAKAYISNYGDNTISIIDTVTDNVIHTINLPARNANSSPYETAIYKDDTGKHLLYMPNNDAQGIDIIDLSSNTVVNTISRVGYGPGAQAVFISIDQASKKAYCSIRAAFPIPQVEVIDLVSNTLLTSINILGTPRSIAFNKALNTIYVTSENTNSVFIIDPNTNTVIGSIPVGLGPFGIFIDNTVNKAFVCNKNDSTISIINTLTNTVSNTINSGDGMLQNPRYCASKSIIQRLYSVHPNGISIINTVNNNVINTVTSGFNAPESLAIGNCTSS